MALAYRPAASEDLDEASQLVADSINDLSQRHGFGRLAVPRTPDFQSFCLRNDPGGLWVAEDAGRVVGFGFSWITGDLWYLAQLFVASSHQGRGIGRALLERTLRHERENATTRALITFGFNLAALTLYLQYGLVPRMPIYSVAARRDSFRAPLGGEIRCTPLEPTSAHLDGLALTDKAVLGVSREKHHAFLIGSSPLRGFALEHAGEWLGYFYAAPDGHIGPLAVTDRAALGGAFSAALALVASDAPEQVSAFLPGASGKALSIAIEHGMRITCPMVLMSDVPFGSWDQYLPRNPAYL